MASERYLIYSMAVFGSGIAATSNTPAIAASFDLDQDYGLPGLPTKISRTLLPCLIPIPVIDGNMSFKMMAFSGGNPRDDVHVIHRLLYAEASQIPDRLVIGRLVAMKDAYVARAKTVKSLDTQPPNPPNQVYLQFSTTIGVTEWEGVQYHTIDFNHKYTLNL